MPAARRSSPAAASRRRALALTALLAIACSCGSRRADSPRPGDPVIEWAIAVSASESAGASDVAAGADGAVAVCGRYAGTLALGDARLPAADDVDGFVAMLAPDGRARWLVATRGVGFDQVRAVALAPDGRVAIAGRGVGPGRLADRPLPPVYVAVLDPNGAPSWIVAIDADDHADIADLAFTAGGELVAVGYGAGRITVGEHAVTSAGSHDALMIRFDRAGAVRWLRRAGGAAADHAHAVATYGEDVVVAGGFARTADFGGATLRSNHHQDGFLAALDASGEVRWVNSFGGSARDSALAVAVRDPLIVVAGTFESSDASFGSGTLEAEDGAAGFAAGFSLRGEPRWSLRLGDRASDASAIAIDDDRVWIGGTFEHAQTAGTIELDSRGKRDAVILSADHAGALLGARVLGSAGHDDLAALALAGRGVIAVGSYSGPLRADATTLSTTTSSGFVVRLSR